LLSLLVIGRRDISGQTDRVEPELVANSSPGSSMIWFAFMNSVA
jgi:hypothetical protein